MNVELNEGFMEISGTPEEVSTYLKTVGYDVEMDGCRIKFRGAYVSVSALSMAPGVKAVEYEDGYELSLGGVYIACRGGKVIIRIPTVQRG